MQIEGSSIISERLSLSGIPIWILIVSLLFSLISGLVVGTIFSILIGVGISLTVAFILYFVMNILFGMDNLADLKIWNKFTFSSRRKMRK